MRFSASRSRQGGFNLIELMVVVVILSILAAIAVVGYRKYIARARTVEATVVLSEMTSREQTYRLEFAMYLPLRFDGNWGTLAVAPPSEATASWGLDEAVGGFYPVSPTSANFDSSRTPTSIINPAVWPATWRAIGLRPRENALYCTYMTNAGNAVLAAGDTLVGYGIRAFAGTVTMNSPWYYSIASCNMSGPDATSLDQTSVFTNSSLSPTIANFNENQ